MQILIAILFVHWFADFVMQTDWQAKNKSSNNVALLCHTLIYSIFWMWLGLPFLLITLVCHTLTDYVTSRINTKLWKANQVHFFFVSVGFDQFLHYLQLFLTYKFLSGANLL